MPKKKSFLLRLDPQLYDILQKWAQDEFRSVNAHIEYLLREQAKQAGRLPGQKANYKAKIGLENGRLKHHDSTNGQEEKNDREET